MFRRCYNNKSKVKNKKDNKKITIESKFNQGEIDRIELTQQKLITMQYKRRFYTNKITLMKIGYDFEALLQEPLNNKKNNEK